MKTAIALFAFAIWCTAADHPATIPANSAIYVDPESGLEKYLSAALQANRVPLQVVTSPEKADFTLDTAGVRIWDETDRKSAGTVLLRTSEKVVRLSTKAGEVVWLYAPPGRVLKKGGQSLAEDCVKHLKERVAVEGRR